MERQLQVEEQVSVGTVIGIEWKEQNDSSVSPARATVLGLEQEE